MSVEQFIASKEYKKMKKQYEKEYFKLFGKYCSVNSSGMPEQRTAAEFAEYFKNKKVTLEFEVKTQTKKGTYTQTKTETRNFYQIWSEAPDMLEYKELVFEPEIE